MNKHLRRLTYLLLASIIWNIQTSLAQQIDDQRMNRDVKVAENVLTTIIRQKLEGSNTFFPLTIVGNYRPGVGVTFVLPTDYTTPMVLAMPSRMTYEDNQPIMRVNSGGAQRFALTPEDSDNNAQEWRLRNSQEQQLDSLRDLANDKLIEAAKEFMVDYGNLLTQLPEDEKVIITNRGGQPKVWMQQLVTTANRAHITITLSKADLVRFEKGKMNRHQILDKIEVVNAPAMDTVEPDLELLSTIFTRLYREDLATTYFMNTIAVNPSGAGVYYERMKDYGAIFYMQVYSSNGTYLGTGDWIFSMPTVGLQNMNRQQRDIKTKELYPVFIDELKDNMMEYGRTIKSLAKDEQLVFNIKLTQCPGCGIPESVELSVKEEVLKAYNDGKMSKKEAAAKIVVTAGPEQ